VNFQGVLDRVIIDRVRQERKSISKPLCPARASGSATGPRSAETFCCSGRERRGRPTGRSPASGQAGESLLLSLAVVLRLRFLRRPICGSPVHHFDECFDLDCRVIQWLLRLHRSRRGGLAGFLAAMTVSAEGRLFTAAYSDPAWLEARLPPSPGSTRPAPCRSLRVRSSTNPPTEKALVASPEPSRRMGGAPRGPLTSKSA
jgi:hypothetical protein